MSDDLMRPIYEMQQNHRANRGAAEEIDAIDQVANHIEAQATEITRLRVELATARREGMEEAAKWHDEQAAKAQKLSDMKVSAEDEKVWGDYAENHREFAAEIRAAAEEREP